MAYDSNLLLIIGLAFKLQTFQWLRAAKVQKLISSQLLRSEKLFLSTDTMTGMKNKII